MPVTINGDGLIDVGGTSTTQGRVRLAEDTDNGTNYIELTAPASVGSNRTITFPDATTTVVGTDATQSFTNKSFDSASVPTVSGTAPLYFARAWVNFSGTGTVTIRASGNVTSITDNGTGDYTVNFTTALADANYSVVGTVGETASATFGIFTGPRTATPTTSAFRFLTTTAGPTNTDYSFVQLSVFR